MDTESEKRNLLLIIVTCTAYAITYLARLSFAANITAIATELNASNDQLGMVSSFLFFAYGGCQILNFFVAKRYSLTYTVPVALTVSGLCNFLLTVTENVDLMKAIWLVNGLFQGVIWCNVLNVQVRFLSAEGIKKCVLWGGLSYCIGTFAVYGLSALLINVNYKITFYIITALCLGISAVWIFTVKSAYKNAPAQKDASAQTPSPDPRGKNVFTGYFLLPFALFVAAAFFNAFLRDGIMTWLPSVLKDSFSLDDSVAVLITMGLTLLCAAGIFLARFLGVRAKSLSLLMCSSFTATLVLAGASAVFYKGGLPLPFVAAFGIMICLVYSNVNVISSQMPFRLKKYTNTGGIAALFDAFCYSGSTAATYLLGLISKNGNWLPFITAVGTVAAIGALLSATGGILAKKDPLSSELL
ncbi:MAG: MFS transporter [Clostridia bacterium]|nr:MFS transporter [Clostridia bacterium]